MTDATQPTTPDPDETRDDAELDDVPAAAGGNDDARPAQGDGESNSY